MLFKNYGRPHHLPYVYTFVNLFSFKKLGIFCTTIFIDGMLIKSQW